MRVMSMLSLFVACGLAIYGATQSKEVLPLVTEFLSAAYGGKLIQKSLEK